MAEDDANVEGKRWSKAADEKLRKMFLANARQQCDPIVRKFVECSKENGMMVVFNCRQENTDMNDCVRQYSSDEKWKAYRKEKIQGYVREGKVIIDRDSARVGPPE